MVDFDAPDVRRRSTMISSCAAILWFTVSMVRCNAAIMAANSSIFYAAFCAIIGLGELDAGELFE